LHDVGRELKRDLTTAGSSYQELLQVVQGCALFGRTSHVNPQFVATALIPLRLGPEKSVPQLLRQVLLRDAESTRLRLESNIKLRLAFRKPIVYVVHSRES